jgi:hypothetical protein
MGFNESSKIKSFEEMAEEETVVTTTEPQTEQETPVTSTTDEVVAEVDNNVAKGE